MADLIFRRGEFIFRCGFEDRHIPKAAGFLHRIEDGPRIVWFTPYASVAIKLREYADSVADKEINRATISFSPWIDSLRFPKELTPKKFQLESAIFSLSRSKSYLALDPGLGKTIVAALIGNSLECPLVFICPTFLARNVEYEFKKWSTWNPDIGRLAFGEEVPVNPDVLIVPDSITHRSEVKTEIEKFVEWANIVGKDPLLIVDEAHRYKSSKSMRSRALLGDDKKRGVVRLFDKQIWMSGTPMPNRPIELYPVLSKVAPETIDYMSEAEYGMRYCNGYYKDHGYDYSGDSNLYELQGRVYGRFMLRLRKKDVLKELPPKTEEIIIIGDTPAKLIPMEKAILRAHSPDDLMSDKVSTEHIATYRRELGLYKVKASVEYIKSILEDTDEALVVFAYHKEVMTELASALALYNPLIIKGGVTSDKKHEAVKTFQTDKSRRLIILNYLAGGVGVTLTKASRVISVEFSWVPSDNDQSGDRVHRIGQIENVFIQYLVFANSLDRKMIETNIKKRRVTGYI